jgi:hypothetical protein
MDYNYEYNMTFQIENLKLHSERNWQQEVTLTVKAGYRIRLEIEIRSPRINMFFQPFEGKGASINEDITRSFNGYKMTIDLVLVGSQSEPNNWSMYIRTVPNSLLPYRLYSTWIPGDPE